MDLPVEPKPSKYLSRVSGRRLGRMEDRKEEVGSRQNVAVGKMGLEPGF